MVSITCVLQISLQISPLSAVGTFRTCSQAQLRPATPWGAAPVHPSSTTRRNLSKRCLVGPSQPWHRALQEAPKRRQSRAGSRVPVGRRVVEMGEVEALWLWSLRIHPVERGVLDENCFWVFSIEPWLLRDSGALRVLTDCVLLLQVCWPQFLSSLAGWYYRAEFPYTYNASKMDQVDPLPIPRNSKQSACRSVQKFTFAVSVGGAGYCGRQSKMQELWRAAP